MKTYRQLTTTTQFPDHIELYDHLTDESRVGFKHLCIRVAARVWAFLTWGRLTALGLFLAALVTALCLKPR